MLLHNHLEGEQGGTNLTWGWLGLFTATKGLWNEWYEVVCKYKEATDFAFAPLFLLLTPFTLLIDILKYPLGPPFVVLGYAIYVGMKRIHGD